MLLCKLKKFKRLKTTVHLPKPYRVNIGCTTSQSPNSNAYTMYTPNATSLRSPLADITTSMTNRKIVEQVIVEGETMSVMFEGSLPRPSHHGFRI